MNTMTTTRPQLSIDRLMSELKALAQISEAEPPVVTRVVFGEADMRARAYVKGLVRSCGPRACSHDAIGNTFARWEGSDPIARAHRHRLAYRRDPQRGPL